jgi:hemerythrin-like domain-containing protein
MRRHPALRSLSSDHHVGLVIARRARKTANEGARAQEAAWEVVKSRFFTEVEGHFRHEEQGLLPMLRTAGEVTLVQRTLSEHRTLRTLIADDRPENLSVFAELLAAHVRFEESELFETAQRLLGLDALAQLEQVPTDARQTVHGPAEPKGDISS